MATTITTPPTSGTAFVSPAGGIVYQTDQVCGHDVFVIEKEHVSEAGRAVELLQSRCQH